MRLWVRAPRGVSLALRRCAGALAAQPPDDDAGALCGGLAFWSGGADARPAERSGPALWAPGVHSPGREKSAWALIGTSRIASRFGQTIGPPAEKAYAVDPVGVEITTPSQPQVERGRPSISTVSSIMRSREAFSTVTSLRAQEEKTCSPPRRARTWSASRSSTRQSPVTAIERRGAIHQHHRSAAPRPMPGRAGRMNHRQGGRRSDPINLVAQAGIDQ